MLTKLIEENQTEIVALFPRSNKKIINLICHSCAKKYNVPHRYWDTVYRLHDVDGGFVYCRSCGDKKRLDVI